MNKETGGPAFPRVVEQPNGYMKAVEGMTLRDYFAAKAMQAFMTGSGMPNDVVAMYSYKLADEMLKARGEKK